MNKSKSFKYFIKTIKYFIKNKIYLFINYLNIANFLPFNELKNDEQSNIILETFKKIWDLSSQILIKTFSFHKFSIIKLIISVDENKENF